MDIKLISDSCCDLSKELLERLGVSLIPLRIEVGTKQFIDDRKLEFQELLSSMKSYKGAAKTSCPSPDAYAEEMRQHDESYVVTLSSRLSGSYQSAEIAKELVQTASPEKYIHIFDSKSACAGQTRIMLELRSLIDKGLSREALVEAMEQFIAGMKTNFVLESLDNLIKNGRVNRIVGQMASLLSLRPIMGADGNGEIALLEKVRGTQKAMERLFNRVTSHFSAPNVQEGPVVIAHCNCPDRAEDLRKMILDGCSKVTEVLVVPTGGISTVYANDGGIVVAY